MKKTQKNLLVTTFAMSVLSGCATLNTTDTTSGGCMDRNGFEFLGLISNRDDQYNKSCGLGYAARAIAAMRKADGSVDYKAYILAVNIYEQSGLEVKKFIATALKEKNTDIKALKQAVTDYKIAESTLCEDVAVEVRQPDGAVQTAVGFQCKTKPPAVLGR
jgi:hypothetical protein